MKNSRKPRRILATSAAALLGMGLLLGSAQAYNPNFWDTNGAVGGLGGTGTWDNNTTANWNDVTGTAVAQNWINPILNNNAIFQGTSGTVTLSGLDGLVVAQTIVFAPTTFVAPASLGYIINGPGTLAMSGAGTIQLGAAASPNSTTTMNNILTDVGGSGITVSSFSNSILDVLTLNGANTFTGGFTVNSGTVNLNTLTSNSSITGSTLTIGTAGFAAVVNDSAGSAIAQTTAVVIGANGTLNLGADEGVGSFSGVAGAKIVLSGSGSLGQLDDTSHTYAGTITGTSTATAIVKGGTGTLTLTGANNYTGITAINGGALNIQNSLALGAADGTAANRTTVLSGATLQLQGGINVGNEALTLAGAGTGAGSQNGALVNVSGTNSFAGALTLTGATTISSNAGTLNLTNTTAVAGAFALTLNAAADTGGGSIAGSINAQTSLTVNGTGSVWILEGNNAAFAGPMTVNNSATLRAGSTAAFGTATPITLNNTATLDLNGNSNTVGSVSSAAVGTFVDNTSAVAATLTTGAAGSTTFAGIIKNTGAGALALTKVGALTTFTLTGANSHAGLTTVDAGILNIRNATALGTTAAGTTVTGGATLQIQGDIAVGTEALTLNGAGAAGQTGALVNVSGTNSYGGALTLGSASTISSDSGTLNLTSTTAVAGGGALTLAGAGDGTLAGGLTAPVITSVTKNGAGTWTLGAAGTVNNYTGATTVNGGTLKAGVANAFGTNSAVNLTAAGATLDLGGFNNAIGSLASAAASIVTNSAAAPPVTLTTGGDNTSTTYAGVITDTGATGALSLNKAGTGIFTLTGANNYNGLTTVAAGALNIQNSTALGAATGVAGTGTTVTAGATLQLQGGIGVGNEALTLNGAGTGAGNQNGALVNVGGANTWGGALTLAGNTTIANNAAAGAANLLTLSNTTGIAGAGPFTLTLNTATSTGDGVLAAGLTNAAVNVLTVNGSGTWTLTGTNTAWTGNTINVNNNAILKAGTGSTNAFGVGSIVNLPGVATLDLNGTTQVVGQLNATAVTETVTNTSLTTPANLTIGTGAGGVALNAAGTAYVGTITQGAGATQPLSLTIAGNGGAAGAASTTFVLGGAGANTYSGLTTINAGQTLMVTNTGATPLGTSVGAADGTLVTGTGMLQLNTAGPLGAPGVNIGNETLILNGIGTGVGGGAGGTGALFSATGTNTANGSIVLQSDSTIAVAAGTLTVGTAGTTNTVTSVGGTFGLTLNNSTAPGSAASTFNNIITGGVGGVSALTINSLPANTGTWVLAGANTYTGPTLIANGTAQAGVAFAGPAAAPTSGAFGINSAVTVNGLGTLDINGFNTAIGSLTGPGTVTNSSLINATLTTGNQGSTFFAGNITNTGGTLNLTKIGAGTTFTLGGTNTYTGLTTVAQGALVAGSQNALGAGSVAPSGVGGAPGVVVNAGASLVLGAPVVGQAAAGGGIAGPLTITLNGTGAAGLGHNGALTASQASTYNGSIFLASNSTISSGGFVLNLGGAAATPAQVINKNGLNLTLTGGGIINVNATITGVAANSDLIVNGTTANLNVANNYNGATIITSTNGVFPNAAGTGDGIVNANVANALPTAIGRSAVRMDLGGNGGSTLNLNNGFNQAVASLSSLATANSTINLNGNTLSIGVGGAIAGTGDAGANFGGVISNGGGGPSNIIKDGTNTQILSGINTYSGTTTVSGGILQAGINQVNGTGGAFGNDAALVVSNNGVADLNGNNVRVGSLNSTSAAAVVTDSAGPATLTIGNGTAPGLGSYIGTFTGSLGLTINGSAGATFTLGGTGTNTYTGLTTVNNGSTLIVTSTGTNPLGATGSVATGTIVNNGATLQLATGGVTIGNEFLTISGTGAPGLGGALDNASGTNNFGGPISLAANSTINVTAGTLNLNGTGNLTSVGGPFALTLNTVAAAALGTSTLIIDSGISSLTATGAGTWRLAGASTYAGPTFVNGGTLQAGVATVGGAAPTSGAFGINSAMTVNAPGIADINGFNTTIGSLAGNGTVNNTSAGGATLTLGNTAGVTVAAPTTFSGAINNTGGPLSITKVGAGTVQQFTGANTYTGNTNVTAGILIAGSAGALGTGTAVPVGLGSPTQLITVSGGASLMLNSGTVGAAATPYTLVLNGTGVAAGTFGAGAIVTPGALMLQAGTSSVFSGSIIAATNSTISTNGGGTLHLGAFGGAIPGQFINKSGVNLTLTGGGTITVNQAIIGAAANSDLLVTGVFTNLNAANTYNGKTIIISDNGAFPNASGTGNGMLSANVANAMPNGAVGAPRSTVQMDLTGNGGSTLNLGFNQSIASLQDLAGANSRVTLNGNTLTIGFGVGADVNGTAGATFNGVISGAGGGITKDQGSTQIFAGLNTYSGATTVVNGKLQAGIGQSGAAGAFGSSSNVTVGTAATLAGPVPSAPTLELAGFNETIGSLSGNATGFVQNNFGALGSNATLTLGSGNGSGNFFGVVQNAPTSGAAGAGTLAITKVGNGTQTFSGPNTYTGATNVNAGTLRAGIITNAGNTAGAFGVNSAVTTSGSGTLDLNGFSNSIGSLSGGSGTVTNTSGGAGGTTLTILTNNNAPVPVATATLYDGLITNSGGNPLNLVIADGSGAGNGNGTQGISNSGNSYTGTTTVNAGATLNIDTSGTPLGSGTLIVDTGATIGTGTNGGATNTINNAVTVNGSFFVTNIPFTGVVPGGAPVVNGPYVPFGPTNLISSGVAFRGPVTLAGAGVTTMTTQSGFLNFRGTIAGGGAGLTFDGNTYTYIGNAAFNGGVPVDMANTYSGTTTVGDGADSSFLLLGKDTAGAFAIPGDVVINSGSYVQYDSDNGAVANQINPTANAVVNGTLDTAGLNQRLNNLTGSGIVRLDDSAHQGAPPPTLAGVLTVSSGNFAGMIVDGGAGGPRGQLVKISPGTLLLTGDSTYGGHTNVFGGTLHLNGSLRSSQLIVHAAGTLTGTGRTSGHVFNAGTFRPGSSPGIFTIGGNYTQTSGGTLVIEIAGKQLPHHDRVVVGGAANLAGNLALVNTNKTKLKVGDKIIFLTAAGGVNGEFENVANDFEIRDSILTADVVYSPNQVALEVQQGSFGDFASEHCKTPNTIAVGRALDRLVWSSKNSKLITFLNTESLSDLCHDFNLIGPDEFQAIYTVPFSQANVQSANISRRLDDIRMGSAGFSAAGLSVSGMQPEYSGNYLMPNGGVAGPHGKYGKEIKEMRPPPENRSGLFFTGFGEFSKLGTTRNASGYDLSAAGFTLGLDYRVNENFALGVNLGYSRSNADLFGSGDLEVDGLKLGLYATYHRNGFYVDGMVQGGLNTYDTRRSSIRGTATGTTDGTDFNALLAFGYDWRRGGLTVGPLASLQYTRVGFQGFREGGSLSPLDFRDQSADSLRSALGAKASYEVRAGTVVIKPEVRLAWQHEFGDSAHAIESSFANGGTRTFNVHGAEIGEDSMVIGAGVAVLWNERTSTYVYYDGEVFRSNYDSNNVSGGVRVEF